MENKLASTLI